MKSRMLTSFVVAVLGIAPFIVGAQVRLTPRAATRAVGRTSEVVGRGVAAGTAHSLYKGIHNTRVQQQHPQIGVASTWRLPSDILPDTTRRVTTNVANITRLSTLRADSIARSTRVLAESAVLRARTVAALPPEQLYAMLWERIASGDTVEAVGTMIALADAGCYALAQYDVASWHANGTYVQQDDERSYGFLLRAAEGGDGDAMAYVGLGHYYGGYGLPVDTAAACRWFERGIAKRNFLCAACLGDAALDAGDTARVFDWYRMALDTCREGRDTEHLRDVAAGVCYNMACFYDSTSYIAPDLGVRVALLDYAAKQRHPEANYELSLLYQRGTDYTPQNDTIASLYRDIARLLGVRIVTAVDGIGVTVE